MTNDQQIRLQEAFTEAVLRIAVYLSMGVPALFFLLWLSDVAPYWLSIFTFFAAADYVARFAKFIVRQARR